MPKSPGAVSPVATSSVTNSPAPSTASALGFVIPPIVTDPVLQQTIDNLAEHINTLVPIHNAQQTNDTFVTPKRKDVAPAVEDKENVRAKTSMGPPEVPVKRKDDDMPGAYHTLRRSTVSSPNPAKPAVSKANVQGNPSNGGRDAAPPKLEKRKSKRAFTAPSSTSLH